MKLVLHALICLIVCAGCTQFQQRNLPRAMGDDEAGNLKKRDLWLAAMHRAAPGTDWKKIEAANARAALQIKKQRRAQNGPNNIQESFANGQLIGSWSEKGAANIAGSNIAIDYDAPTNMIYTISAGGSLWRGPLTGDDWTILNDDIQFSSRTLNVFNKTAGGRRLLLSKEDKLYWSDDEGTTTTECSGIVLPVPWGGNYIAGVVVLNDPGKTIYVLTHNWDNVLGWGARHYLFRSTDEGLNFTRINIFTTGNDNEVNMVNPYNSSEVYVTDMGAVANRIALYEVNGAAVTAVSSATPVVNNGSSPLAGVLLGNTLTLYVLKSNNQLYKRVKTGPTWTTDWTPIAATPTTSWDRLDVGMTDADKLYYGEVDAFRSDNGGTSFTRVNNWYEYYGEESTKLHADIMAIKHFRKTDNSVFQLINNHGGVAVSYNDMVDTENLTLTSFYNSQSYDIITDTLNLNNFYSGTQDQGMQYCSNMLSPGVLDFEQTISGDYGYLALTANNSRLWAIYPGQVAYWTNPTGSGSVPFWQIPGTNIPNYGWMPPLKSTNTIAANEVYVAGGEIGGGSGSHLIKLSASLNDPVTFTPTQLAYNFRANSNDGASNISSFELSKKEPGKMYVATEDGTFFYSNNNGASWSKTATFSGTTGWYLYGQTILASKLTNGLVWYGGSGYSNPGVFKSTNGGVSFTAMDNGLPQTLVHEIAANATETMLFAATDAGPYVYVVADNTWYPMIGISTPAQMFTAVEYIRSTNTVRFATHGRGVFDFQVQSGVLPVTGLQLGAKTIGGKSIQLSWTTLTEINNNYFELERSKNGIAYTKIATVNTYGNGNSSTEQQYPFTDLQPGSGTHFYRVKQVDKDGRGTYSNVVKVNLSKGVEIILAPNPVTNTFSLFPAAEVKEVQLFDAAGKLVKTFTPAQLYDVAVLPKGMYVLHITNKKGELQQIKLLKE
jgi:hypothetical protein